MVQEILKIIFIHGLTLDTCKWLGIFEMVQKILKILFINVVMLAALRVIGDFWSGARNTKNSLHTWCHVGCLQVIGDFVNGARKSKSSLHTCVTLATCKWLGIFRMVQEILKMRMIDNSLQKLPKKEKKSSSMVGSSLTFIKVVLIFTKYVNRYLPSCHMWYFDNWSL
jgi:hypothetical protein